VLAVRGNHVASVGVIVFTQQRLFTVMRFFGQQHNSVLAAAGAASRAVDCQC
jgi:hypothetical protein